MKSEDQDHSVHDPISSSHRFSERFGDIVTRHLASGSDEPSRHPASNEDISKSGQDEQDEVALDDSFGPISSLGDGRSVHELQISSETPGTPGGGGEEQCRPSRDLDVGGREEETRLAFLSRAAERTQVILATLMTKLALEKAGVEAQGFKNAETLQLFTSIV